MGTPDFSVPALNALHETGHDICAVYTRPPAKKGRGMSETLSPVHECADVLGLDVLTPKNFKSPETVATFASHQAECRLYAPACQKRARYERDIIPSS